MTQYQLPDLPYAYDALEPVISEEILKIHHGRHHKAYVDNLNKALVAYAQVQEKGDLAKMKVLQKGLDFNAGGHLNHAFFWESLAPIGQGGGGTPSGALLSAMEVEFGSFDACVQKMNGVTTAIQGSGWGWLAYCKEKNRLVITTTFNQDLVQEQGLVPLLCIDVWEHAYYLQYQNVRADFVKNIWQIVHWDRIEKRFDGAVR